MTWRLAMPVVLVSLLLRVAPSAAIDGSLTFETVPPGLLPFGATYTESGMEATSFSGFSELGDPFGRNPTGNALYFHGTGQYVEFRLADRAPFDLTSFDVLTNGFTDERGVTASSGATQTFSGAPQQTVTLGAGFQNIEWVRIGTPWFATQLDNVSFTVLTSNGVYPKRGGDTGQVTVHVRESQLSNESVVRLRRTGEADIVGVNTVVDPSGTVATTTFDLRGAPRGDWDVVVEIGGTVVTLTNAFTIEEGTVYLTFDTASPSPLPFGSAYTESGVEVISHSDFSSLGAWNGGTNHGLYFPRHGPVR
jgi:hypothetical protein